MIIKCTCENAYQDKAYGKAMRVANPVNKSAVNGKVVEWRCTVCLRQHVAELREPK